MKIWKYPSRILLKHQESIRHIEATKKQEECKRMLPKSKIYKQIYERQCFQKTTNKVQNRRVIKFFITIYIVVKKIWAAREKFQSIIALLKNDLDNADIISLLMDSSSCPHTRQ